jgi:hypothetical protein
MTAKKPILVTGSHRSGSTWVGRMLAEAPAVFYIHEPFSVSHPPGAGICKARFTYWFTYITRKNEAAYYKEWIFLRHEDISREPVVGFRCLYERIYQGLSILMKIGRLLALTVLSGE